MFDQYGNPVPRDLVALDMPITDFTVAEVEAIDALDWYEIERTFPNGPMFVSQAALEEAIGRKLEDLRHTRAAVFYVTRPLHRYGDADGFYHA